MYMNLFLLLLLLLLLQVVLLLAAAVAKNAMGLVGNIVWDGMMD